MSCRGGVDIHLKFLPSIFALSCSCSVQGLPQCPYKKVDDEFGRLGRSNNNKIDKVHGAHVRSGTHNYYICAQFLGDVRRRLEGGSNKQQLWVKKLKNSSTIKAPSSKNGDSFPAKKTPMFQRVHERGRR